MVRFEVMKPVNPMPLKSAIEANAEVELAPGYRINEAVYATMSPREVASLKQGINDVINGQTLPHRQVMDELYHEFAPSNLVNPREE